MEAELLSMRDIKRDGALVWKIFQDLFKPLVKVNETYYKAHCYKCDRDNTVRINKPKGIFCCSSCQFAGDVFTIVGHSHGCSVTEAVKIINEEYVDAE